MKTLGILGGMGSYATCDIFRRLLDAYPAKKEWDRPHILIDNNCTMPSRVRAILYGEHEEQLVQEMSESVEHLVNAGADVVFLGCMTSHFFRDRLPYQDRILDALEITRRSLECLCPTGTVLTCLCTEGSQKTKIWTNALSGYSLLYPDATEMVLLREHIETVKNNLITTKKREAFVSFINRFPSDYVLLGCTELPVLLGDAATEKQIIDPIDCVIEAIKKEL